MEAAAETLDVVFVEIAFAIQDFGDNAGSAEDNRPGPFEGGHAGR